MSRHDRTVKDKAVAWYHSLPDADKWLLGDEFILGNFDWRDWFETKPQPGFLQAVENERFLWEQECNE